MLRPLKATEFDAYINFAYELALDLTRSGYPTWCDGFKTKADFIARTKKSLDRPAEDVLLFLEDGQVEGLIAFQHLEEERCLHPYIFNILHRRGQPRGRSAESAGLSAGGNVHVPPNKTIKIGPVRIDRPDLSLTMAQRWVVTLRLFATRPNPSDSANCPAPLFSGFGQFALLRS